MISFRMVQVLSRWELIGLGHLPNDVISAIFEGVIVAIQQSAQNHTWQCDT